MAMLSLLRHFKTKGKSLASNRDARAKSPASAWMHGMDPWCAKRHPMHPFWLPSQPPPMSCFIAAAGRGLLELIPCLMLKELGFSLVFSGVLGFPALEPQVVTTQMRGILGRVWDVWDEVDGTYQGSIWGLPYSLTHSHIINASPCSTPGPSVKFRD